MEKDTILKPPPFVFHKWNLLPNVQITVMEFLFNTLFGQYLPQVPPVMVCIVMDVSER